MDDLQSKTVISCAEKRIPRGSFAWRLALLAALHRILNWLRRPGWAKAVSQILLVGSLGLSGATAWVATANNGQADLDVVVANKGNDPQDIWLNDGSANFSTKTLGSGYSQGVALGDIDNDGDLDVVIANDFDPQEIWTNDGSANFSVSSFGNADSSSDAVALGDLDGDGDLDAIVANYYDQPEDIWINDGSGNFSAKTFGAGDSTGVALGDLNNDGHLDALITNFGTNQVWLNDGSANFSSQPVAGEFYSRGIALGDLDGDGDLDGVVANGRIYYLNDPQNILWNDGNGNFSVQSTGSDHSLDVALGDLDGDRDLDVIVVNAGPNDIWLNDGSGNFATQTFGGGDGDGIALGDLDGDGDLDAVIATYYYGAQEVWLNDGSANFSLVTEIGGGNSRAIALGDLDGEIPVPVKTGSTLGADKLPGKGLPVVIDPAASEPPTDQIFLPIVLKDE